MSEWEFTGERCWIWTNLLFSKNQTNS